MTWSSIEWLDLILRWFHTMAGISWIGGSLYLLWLDRILASPERRERGEHGEPWLIDLLGSLLVDKLALGPGGLAKTHIWFKRETMLTWVSGLLLLVLIAQLPGGGLLVGARGEAIDGLLVTAIVIVMLAGSWVCYDAIWRNSREAGKPFKILVSFAVFVVLSWVLAQAFSGRAVFILLAAVLGTVLMGNVWFRLLPALKAMKEARDAAPGTVPPVPAEARARSIHNSYLIFPTVVLMVSNHFPAIYGHHLNWLLISLLTAAFVTLRHVVVGGAGGKKALIPVAAIGIGAFLISGLPAPGTGADAGKVSFSQARSVVIARCLSCHSTVPADRSFGPAPAGVAFDRPEDIKRHAARIKVSTVEALTMPYGGDGGMTAAERALLGRWVEQGARLD